ncbi:MAG: BrnA antitoxin family protein [Candidatus Thiosymbion ectosymbiont of Robbea hypermnestra]|nr:BrnA antitoxin family protein [Candidatus Thiosymbion ectosymbiont of Robbea hypermnestra]
MNKTTDEQQRELRRLAELPDADIDTSDIPEIGDFSNAVRGRFYRPVKQRITLRIDAELLDWFRAQGGKYQTHINTALHEYVQGHRDPP